MRKLGAVIAGGKARRFGADKAKAMLSGRPLLDHVAEALSPQVDALIIVGRRWPGFLSLPDKPPGKEGPLAGLNAALFHARSQGFDGVLSAGCDTLPLPFDLAGMLAGPDPAHVAGHYLLGWWPAALAEALNAHLAGAGDRSMRGWIARCGASSIPVSQALHNLNTMADLAAYQRILDS